MQEKLRKDLDRLRREIQSQYPNPPRQEKIQDLDPLVWGFIWFVLEIQD